MCGVWCVQLVFEFQHFYFSMASSAVGNQRHTECSVSFCKMSRCAQFHPIGIHSHTHSTRTRTHQILQKLQFHSINLFFSSLSACGSNLQKYHNNIEWLCRWQCGIKNETKKLSNANDSIDCSDGTRWLLREYFDSMTTPRANYSVCLCECVSCGVSALCCLQRVAEKKNP